MLRAGLLVVGLVLLASPARSQGLPRPAPATGEWMVCLDYVRQPGAGQCPKEEHLHSEVTRRIGYHLLPVRRVGGAARAASLRGMLL